MYGPGTLDEASKRRSIYFTMKRSKLIPMLVIFDAPDGTVGVGDRPSTTMAPQALLMMNNPQVRMWAKALAARVGKDAKTPEEAIRRTYRIALTREATADELAEGRDLREAARGIVQREGGCTRIGAGGLLPGGDVFE